MSPSKHGWHTLINISKVMNRKEKLKLFRELHNEHMADRDLQLLKAKLPLHGGLSTFARNPRYYSAHILYDLLDVCSKEEILENRKPIENPQEPIDDEEKKKIVENQDSITNSSSETSTESSSETSTESSSKAPEEAPPVGSPDPEVPPEDSKKK